MHIFPGVKWPSFDWICLISILWGESKLVKMAWSGSLTAGFINNNYVTTEITAHGHHLVTSCVMPYAHQSFTMKALAAMALGLRWSGIMVMLYEAMSWLYYCCIMVMLWLLLQLPRESGEWLCYDCRASQERINVSVVPTAPSS